MQPIKIPHFLLLDESTIITILVVVVIFFGLLLILGVRKSYKLKQENDRLEDMNKKIAEENEKPYQDFTEDHLYSNKK